MRCRRTIKATFKTFESGAGDCSFLVLKDEKDGSSHHLMVDCNVLTPEIKRYIREDLKLRIDTLIVTHIDADHANGITKLMQTPEFANLQIGQILFNGFQPKTDNVTSLNPGTKEKLRGVLDLLPPVVEEVYHKTNGMVAACLITELNKHPQWRKVWRQEQIVSGKSIVLGDDEKWGCLEFLSPTETALDDLLHKVKLEYAGILGEAPPNGDFEDQDKYFELMLRLLEIRKRPAIPKKTGNAVITKDTLERYAKEDVNENIVESANKASLAFFWKSATKPHKCILMMGDAVSSQVLSRLNEIDNKDIWFEVIKVSHHGSKNNTSVGFIAKVDSAHYFIMGGKRGEGPHIETIAKIVTKPLKEVEQCRLLHYNHTYDFSLWSDLENDATKSLLNEYHFKIIKDNTYEFEC